ncbi:MAG: Soluble hydrogenase 42 kDa subunit [Candidatus Latescibacteria bacterium ADurb.Bin168]|nr:MAG: Soluble hydrogenase 42 kDa subunit [Candidatus Latescibacteria bacterium ADurb.Bin168]
MKTRLYTPGPTMVPEQVSLEMAAPIIHHRTPEFSKVLQSCHEGLQYLFQTKNPVLMLTCSGTGAMEGAVVSVLSRSTLTLVVRGGKFGERWGEICAAYGVPFVPLDVPWGESVTAEQLEEALVANPGVRAVCLTQSETSTGALNDIKALAAVVKKRNALCLVDSITGCGVHELRVDEWGIDVAVTGSQKGLMLPPGLAFAALSDEAWEAVKRTDLPSYYLSFAKHRKSWEKTTTPWTPAITLLTGLARALEMIRSEGLEKLWERHQTMAEAMRQAVRTLGLPLFPRVPANVQTVIALPDGLDYSRLSKQLFNVYGMKTAGGQDQLTGKILRVAHLGYLDDGDIVAGVSFLERALADVGWKVNSGEAVAAAQRVLSRTPAAQ